MGQVISILETRAVKSLDFIGEAYAKLAGIPGFIIREGQEQLSRGIFDSLVNGVPLAAEAPTGTGKTIAYLIGALGAAEQMRISKDIPIVVATATIGLQQQIMSGDIPRLVQAKILPKDGIVLAKGRSRYFCRESGVRALKEAPRTNQYDLLSTTHNDLVETSAGVRGLFELFEEGRWDGDKDTFPGKLPTDWEVVAASVDTCIGKKCASFETCAFFKARAHMSQATLIIANHDLVLSDLSMSKTDMEPLFPGGHYFCVFDEAHNLPDKAIEVGSASINLLEAHKALETMPMLWGALSKNVDILKLLARNNLEKEEFNVKPMLNALKVCAAHLKVIEVDPDTKQLRFPAGNVPRELFDICHEAMVVATNLSTAMSDTAQHLKSAPFAEKNPSAKAAVAESLFMLSQFNSKMKALAQGFSLFTDGLKGVRWVYADENTYVINVSPVEGADVLKRILWGNPRLSFAFASATLKDFEGFDRFKMRSGAPANLRTMALPHIFPYRSCELRIVDMKNSPQYHSRAQYDEELISLLPLTIDDSEGSLILFPSASLMRRAIPTLREAYPLKIFVQNEKGIKDLLSDYKSEIDAGRGAILCGLATMAEGLDLPGKYCTHVLICTVPFAVPTSPVEQELQELLGTKYFAEKSLPDALTKLVQMVGRLMRRESDRGRITLFDKRLVYEKWGRQLLQALPNFKKKTLSLTEIKQLKSPLRLADKTT